MNEFILLVFLFTMLYAWEKIQTAYSKTLGQCALWLLASVIISGGSMALFLYWVKDTPNVTETAWFKYMAGYLTLTVIWVFCSGVSVCMYTPDKPEKEGEIDDQSNE